MLAEFYNEVNAAGKKLEMIFLSCDEAQHEYDEYTATMPWKALPFKDPKINSLSTKYNVTGIPRLVIISKDGKVVVDNARGDVQTKGAAAYQNWVKLVPK